MHKGVLVILDGLGDRPAEALGGRTPLEAASTPCLDRLASEGLSGLVHPLAPGVPVGTQIGVGLLMGLARLDIPHLSRGPVEAAGVGLTMQPGDVVLRANFATLERDEERLRIIDRRAGRDVHGLDRICRDLEALPMADGLTVRVRPSTQHRAVVLLRGEGLSDAVTDTDPGAGHEEEGLLPCRPREADDPAAGRTARALNAFLQRAFNLLCTHPVNRERTRRGGLPVNGLLTRGAGRLHPVRNLIRHLNLSTMVVAGEGTIVGLSRLFGFDVCTHPAFTAYADTNMALKFDRALEAVGTHDFVVLHIKGTDTFAHDHDPVGKKDFIEAVDRHLTDLAAEAIVLGVTGDHTTDSRVGRHTGDPVPGVIRGPHGRRDPVTSFSERAAMQGGLGHLSATSFLCTLLDHMGAMHNHRAHEYIYY